MSEWFVQKKQLDIFFNSLFHTELLNNYNECVTRFFFSRKNKMFK